MLPGRTHPNTFIQFIQALLQQSHFKNEIIFHPETKTATGEQGLPAFWMCESSA